MRPPCYNIETHTDCPDRKGGCTVGCKKWAAYVTERDKQYGERMRLNEEEHVFFKIGNARRKKYLKSVIESTRVKRRR